MEWYKVAQKSKPLPTCQKIVLNRIKVCQLDYISEPNYRNDKKTIILSVGIKYSLRDLLFDVKTMPGLQNSDMRHIR